MQYFYWKKLTWLAEMHRPPLYPSRGKVTHKRFLNSLTGLWWDQDTLNIIRPISKALDILINLISTLTMDQCGKWDAFFDFVRMKSPLCQTSETVLTSTVQACRLFLLTWPKCLSVEQRVCLIDRITE